MIPAICFLASCDVAEIPVGTSDPYAASLRTLEVTAVYPDEYKSSARAGVKVRAEEINLGHGYEVSTDGRGVATFTLPCGLYRISLSDVGEDDVFNGSADKVAVKETRSSLSLPLLHSRPGSIIIKEIYCGGCKRLPLEGNYQYDQYIIVHNNDFRTRYLDGLCIGSLYPYNSNSNNPFSSVDPATGKPVLPSFSPVSEAVWMFGGDGTRFPLEPGEDAVVVLKGAIDHSRQYPLSVNLDNPDYFVCYNSTYFTNTGYHPAPGPHIQSERILEVVMKTGVANAYTFSINSPAVILYRAKGMTMREYVQTEGAIRDIPGNSSSARVVAIPEEWIEDAVEVFNGASAGNNKRFPPTLDAGYVTLENSYLGHSLHRLTDEKASAESGYEVLMDTNNSSKDFYERNTSSLHHD